MLRFPSFTHVPSETRRILRDRFARKLPVARQARFLDPDAEVTPDHVVLAVLSGLTVLSNAEWLRAETAYAEAGPTGSEPPNLQTLADLGWVRQIWGRVQIARDIRLFALSAPSGEMKAFKLLVSGVHDQRYEATETLRSNPELIPLIAGIEAGQRTPPQIVCRTPEWIAARLWEVLLEQEAAPDSSTLRRWVDLWALLQCPPFVPDEVWSPSNATLFREIAIRVIAAETSLGDWKTTRDMYVRQAVLAHDLPQDVADSNFSDPPATLVDRALWVTSQSVEGSTYASLEACEDLLGLARLLLADADAQENSPAPHPVATQVIDLAMERTELFIDLLFHVRNHPKLLADLSIHPPTAGLACLLITQWRSPMGAWDRGLVQRDFQVSQGEAFADAVAMLGEHLRAGKLDASEAAALLNWLHDRAGPDFIDDVGGADSLIEALRRELTDCASSVLLAMVQSLDGPDLHQGIGTSAFAAALDLSDLGGIADEVDAEAIVGAYVQAISSGGYSLSAHRIGVAGSTALSRMAERTQALRARFLYPLDIPARLASVASTDNAILVLESLGRSLRTHIRILGRAIVGSSPDIPGDLIDALIAAVRAGALEHKEKGRIAAFAPRFETRIGGIATDRPLAADLAAVLTRIDHPQQENLLAAILETDEPLILAQLLSASPQNLQSDIKQRLAALAPADAGRIHTLPEMQARIDALLTSGAADAAASYMASEASLNTLGKSPGRELTRFRNQLRLHLLQENWTAIEAMAEPRFTAPHEQAEAVEMLRQCRGLAAIKGPNADPEGAKTLFLDLFARRPSLALAANWFAAAIMGLLQKDNFVLLQGDRLRQGQKALAEFERMVGQVSAGKIDDGAESNRALLLLALGEPTQALAILTTMTAVHLQDTAAAYRAVALDRLGRRAEATASLDAAEHAYGVTRVLAVARNHIASGAPYFSAPEISIQEGLADNVASAIARFRTMNPIDQARVLQGQTDSFVAVLVEFVRAAADAVVSLVPMMKGVQIDTIEDDLTAFIQHLLAARTHFLGWSVADQSKGGYSAKGNAGERDLVITWGSSVLAPIEAVICDKPLTQDVMKADLESHFQKLFGYANARVFFHLTYAYIEDKTGLMTFLETMSETSNPSGFNFLRREPIAHQDSRPPGFIAHYSGDFGEVIVVFLVLNLGQQRQKQAAQVAGATKVRKAPKS